MTKKTKIRLLSVGILLSLCVTVVLAVGCSALGTKPDEKRRALFEKSPQFRKQKEIFVNRNEEIFAKMSERNKASGGFLKFLFGSDKEAKPENGLPVLKPLVAEFLKASDDIKVIWFGHSTFMLNMKGKIILIDPILSDYASPVFFIMRRFQAPPLTLEELPKIDYVLISHDHYDHLDMPTIKYFKEKETKFLVPLGVGGHMVGWGIEPSRISELDWWESRKFEDLELIATPAQHFSGRSYNDRNATLWAGWIVRNSKHSIYFSGDSGYDTHFKVAGDKYGPFDMAFLDNGQYNKRWEEVHMLPEQVVQAYYDLKAKALFPVHWGVFKLSTHTWYEPIQKAYQFSLEKKFPIVAPKIGEIVVFNKDYQVKNWWDELIPTTR